MNNQTMNMNNRIMSIINGNDTIVIPKSNQMFVFQRLVHIDLTSQTPLKL